ncbi:MAG: GNAT family N-acetyltransferase [Prolixibacteraceae bacterium]
MYLTVALSQIHPKEEFSCENESLTTYLRRQAGQDIKRRLAGCFVLTDHATGLIKGYYTLSNNSIFLKDVPEQYKRKLPPYPSIPVTLLGRLAADKRYLKQGVGSALLIDALKRSYDISGIIGSYAVVVDPFDGNAVSFYAKYGFILLPDSRKMFLPMKTIETLFR